MRRVGWRADRRHGSGEQGSNLVEMALSLFILVIFLIGVADIGRAFHTYITITNAAREGARYGSRVPQVDDIDDSIRAAVVEEAANSGVDLSDGAGQATISIAPPVASRLAGQPLIVTVDYTYPTILGGMVGLSELHLHTETDMVLFTTYGATP